jgi:deazaflavin-dependent oxidoreductase (nitroreductase family)
VERQQALDFNTRNIAEFRASGGTLKSFGDAPVLLLTTVGAKSGQPRTSPMMYLACDNDSDLVYVFASAAGNDTNPRWFTNIVANPDDLTVEIGRSHVPAAADVLRDPERARIYDIQAARYPGFRGYQDKTTRPIPVVALRLQRAST